MVAWLFIHCIGVRGVNMNLWKRIFHVNAKIKLLAEQAKVSVPAGLLVNEWIDKYNELFAQLIVQECIASVGSQADKAYLKKHFGLPVESDIVYPATEESWSVKSQYNREYNFPK
jgi:hypothetical protein